MSLILGSAALLLGLAYYLYSAAGKPELIYQNSAANKQLIQATPRLERRFWPSPWMFNTHLQLIWLGMRKAWAADLQYDHVDTIKMPDGGTTALNWLGSELPAETPTLLVLHTITGSPQSMRGFVSDVHRLTGWRVVLCQRRGHGDLKLSSPRFNTMGDTDDLRQHIQLIQARYPNSPLYAAGVSAGTGLLVRYLGEQGRDTPLQAAFAYCPGYDISTAFSRAKPFYSRLMAKKLLAQFFEPYPEYFQTSPNHSRLSQCEDLHTLHQHIHACAGYDSQQAYLSASNPVLVMDKVSIPLLVLNAEDDPVCAIENLRDYQHSIQKNPHTMVAVTKRGSHCAHFEGWRARPWAHALAAEFLLAAHGNAQP